MGIFAHEMGVAGTRLAGGHEGIPKSMVFPSSRLQNRLCM